VKDGKLQINVDGDEFHTLKPAGETSFHVADVPWGDQVEIRFLPASAENPRRLEQSFGGEKPDILYLNPRRRLRRAARNCVSMWALYGQRRNRPGLPHCAAGREFESDEAQEEGRGSSASCARRFYRGHWHSALHA